MLPHSDAAERAVLGAILSDNRQVSKAAAILVTEELYASRHRRIFRACARLSDVGRDLATIFTGFLVEQFGDGGFTVTKGASR